MLTVKALDFSCTLSNTTGKSSFKRNQVSLTPVVLLFWGCASLFKQHPQTISLLGQKQYMEATCCDKQDVHQDVGFKRRDYRAVPTGLKRHNRVHGGCSCHVESGNARSAASPPNRHVLSAFSDGDGHWTAHKDARRNHTLLSSFLRPARRRRKVYLHGGARSTDTGGERHAGTKQLPWRKCWRKSSPLYCSELLVRIFTVPLIDSPGP